MVPLKTYQNVRENTLVEYFIPKNIKTAKIQITSLNGKVLGMLNIPEVGKTEFILV